MDFSLSTIGCSLPVCLTSLAGKRKLALHSPSKPQAPFSPSSNEDSALTASNASSWCSGTSTRDAKNGHKIVLNHKDSFLVYLEQAASVLNLKGEKFLEDDDDDDDTLSTASFTSSSSASESSSNSLGSCSRSVTFAEQVVTQVHYRPYTSRRDKYFLHYNEHDYVDFKMEYLTGRGRNRKVSFQCEDATVHQLPPPGDATKQDLFYSEQELQGFLDEFVQSLSHRL